MDYGKPHWTALFFGLGANVVCLFIPIIWTAMPQSVAWIGFSFGLALVAYGAWPLLSLVSLKWVPWGLISLPDAAIKAYEKVQNRTYGQFAEEIEESPDGIQRWFAVALLAHKMPVYGRRLPSTRRTLLHIDPGELVDGGRSIQPGHGAITHTDLAIKRKDLALAIRNMRNADEILGKAGKL